MSNAVGRPWRCYNPKCADKPGVPGHVFHVQPSTDFMAVTAVCDRCGIRADDARFGRLLTPLRIIHFEPPSGIVEGVGVGYAACAPHAKAEATAAVMRSGVARAVNCPACQETTAFREAQARAALTADDALSQVPIEIDTVKGTSEIKPPVPAAA